MTKDSVFRQILVVLLGEVLGCAAMFGIFALLGRLDGSVLLGGGLGSLFGFLNFFFMAVSVSVAVDRAASGNAKGGQGLLAVSRMVRYIVLFGLLFLTAKSGRVNVIALVAPLLFQQPSLLLYEFFRKSGEAQK